MSGSDIAMCDFKLSSATNNADQFICTDRYASAWALPVVDTEQDITTVSTESVFDSVNIIVNLKVTFERKLNTGDPNNGQDHTIYSNIDSVWAWGKIVSNSEQYHGNAVSDRGTWNQRIVRINNAIASISFTLATIVGFIMMPIIF